MESSQNFYYFENGNLFLNVLATPGSKQTKILKPHGDELKISIATPAQKQKATKELIKFLAKTFGVRERDVELLQGATNPHKRFCIHNPTKLPEVIEICDSL